MKILVTGAAGFIGSYLVRKLLSGNVDCEVVGLDNMNGYYDISLKEWRLANICPKGAADRWHFVKGDISDKDFIFGLFEKDGFDIVVNLAAQAGVRYSIENPDAYICSNIVGFYNILEACRRFPVKHLVYASSSSVYGDNAKIPCSVEDKADSPVSLYAATKKSDELLAYAYNRLYDIPCTGLRFFTVYGPAGRPDMAYFKFADRLRAGKDIEIYNYGNCRRDFTYIDDIVEGLSRVISRPPEKHIVYNIGNSHPENLLDFVMILQEELVRVGVLPENFDFESRKRLLPMQPGDVAVTYADTSALERDFGFRPDTPLRTGLGRFAEWYKDFYL